LPSYLAQLYAYAKCKLEIEIDNRDVIKELYGTEDEDVLTDKEEANSETIEEESTEVPLEASGDTEESDQSDYVSSVQTQTKDMNEPFMAATTRDFEVSKPQQSDLDNTGLAIALLNLGEREEEVQKQDGPSSGVKFVKSTRDIETETDQGSEIQEELGQTRIPIDHMDTRTEQYPY
jgi:hypothetical protein